MRSHLVHLAKAQVPNYFLLIHLTAKATRAFHKPKNCIGKTINQALERIAAQTNELSGLPQQMSGQAVARMGLIHPLPNGATTAVL